MNDRKLYLGPLTDNRRWDRISLRPDDVIVVTPPKCGTTWMQTSVALLLSGDPDVEPELSRNMPWIDIRVRDIEPIADHLAGMQHRRSMKSHTPMDGLPLDDKAHYICVFRHPLDAHFSMRNHMRVVPMPWYASWYPEEDDAGVAFHHFLNGGPEGFDGDAMPLAHILRHYKAAKAVSDRPNVSLFHYADMKRDLAKEFTRLSDILGTSHPDEVMRNLVNAASFDNMKANADRFSPAAGKGFSKSDAEFFHTGSNGKWQGQLTSEQLERYDAMMAVHLSDDERAWLEYGANPE